MHSIQQELFIDDSIKDKIKIKDIYSSLLNEAADAYEKLEQIYSSLCQLKNKHIFEVYDRVQLIHYYDTKEADNVFRFVPKCVRTYLVPANPATVIGYRLINNELHYKLSFDKMPEQYKNCYVYMHFSNVRKLRRELYNIKCIEDIREFFTGKRY